MKSSVVTSNLVLGMTMLISACANVSETYGPDGSRVLSLDCSGSARTWSMCIEKAGELCGAAGYDVVNRTGDTGQVMSGSQFGVFGGTVMTRGMVVRCKSPQSSTSATKPSMITQTRPIAMRWEGYSNLISGVITLVENGRQGRISAALPGGDGQCAGLYEFTSPAMGNWTITCTNGRSALGSFEVPAPGKSTTGRGKDRDGRDVEFTIGGT